ncbi:specifically androgen-regulated gene protein [Pithys albifrons albifrons]|uniref:specifically androgen-regulated gene protein n=1 Tax=Pithys albifrons albifrons TaxID=3385563 RepID=UPI003A5CCC9A
MPRKELGMAGCNAGSCDSMVSTASNHSQRSDNSYDYLSVEEKECLMFLEETIGSLDAEADSGVSTDETEYAEPSKLPGMWPKKDPMGRDLGNGAPPPSRGQQVAAEQKNGKSISASSSSAPAGVPSPGYFSLPRSIPAANRAADSRVTVHTAKDPVPGEKPSQEVAKEDRLDQANTRSHVKSMGSLIVQPPDPFQDDYEWSRSNRSEAKGEIAKESKTWASWGQPEKSTLEEAPQDPDAKRGPPTAPKPRKLPPNIILKTSKNSPVPLATEHNQKVKAPPQPAAGSHHSSASDAAAEKVNSGHLDPKEKEKARREALEKLGLAQDRREPSAHLQPPTHAQPRETPLPIPGEPEAAERSMPGIRQITFKSNTLERSGVGLSSSMANAKEQNVKTSSSLGKMSFIERLAPSFLRSGRPRPVSLGAGKDFAGLKEQGQMEQEKSSKRRSHPLPSFPRPPRSAVSVKISPKGATDENRREALKKLGLLKE